LNLKCVVLVSKFAFEFNLRTATLRRLKRTFLKLVANSLARTHTTRDQIKKLFIEYVQQNAEQD
jgi:hypothetical protein